MSAQEKKWQRIYYLLNAKIKPKRFFKIIGVSLWPTSSPDLKPLDYSIWGVIENKANTISYQNIGSLKIVIKNKWNKMPEEFISKACKLFLSYVDTIIEKNGGYIE